MDQERIDAARTTDAAPAVRARRGWQEIGATVVLMGAVGALGYVLLSEKHSRELDELRSSWSNRIRAIETQAAMAEETASKLSAQANRLALELPALSAARDELQNKLASAEATIASDRAQAHRDIAQAEEMNASLRRELEAVLEEYTKALVDADRDLQRVTRERDEALVASERLQDELAHTRAAYAEAEAEAAQIMARLVEVFPALAQTPAPSTPRPEAASPNPRLAEQPPAPTATPEAVPDGRSAARNPGGLMALVQDFTRRDWTDFFHGCLADLQRATESPATVSAGASSHKRLPAESF